MYCFGNGFELLSEYIHHIKELLSLKSNSSLEVYLHEESKESIRTSTASILDKSRLPARNTTLEERKALKELKKDKTRVITKADKGNCFVVIDRKEYDEKMNVLLNDKKTYKNREETTIQEDRARTKCQTPYTQKQRKIK